MVATESGRRCVYMTGVTETAARAEQAYRDATTGDFSESEETVASLANASDPASRAWCVALRAQRWHAERSAGALPTCESLVAFANGVGDARIAAALACAEAVRAAVLQHRVVELAAGSALLQQLVKGDEDSWAAPAAKICGAWLALAGGAFVEANQLADQARTLASRTGIAPGVIEATVIRALCAEAQGEIAEATSLARRASRMARTEDLPQWQYLANLVLARMRRLNGTPHLTTRILTPLLQVAPSLWHGWIAWEALMAGALDFAKGITLDDDNDPLHEARLLRQLFDAAAVGDRTQFSKLADRLTNLEDRFSSRAQDVALALASLDAARTTEGMAGELEAWCGGDAMAPPNPIKGLCIDLQSDANEPARAAFVVARPAEAGDPNHVRRVAGLGEPIVDADARMPRARGASERTPSTVAAIALAGPEGIGRQDLFRTVYGFEYDHEVHRGLFKALMHRVRTDLGEWGEVKVTSDDCYTLSLNCALVIPDPRCEHSLEDVVLWTLASVGAQSAKEASDGSGLPLRTTQRTIKRLVESGALIVERVRNGVKYRVEDTTFSEPTKWS